MRELNNLEKNIFYSTNKIYNLYYPNKNFKINEPTDIIRIGIYEDSLWYYLFGNTIDGFCFYNNIYITRNKNKLNDISLLAHEFVHTIQFRHKPIMTLIRLIWERLFYGKKMYQISGNLENEARFIQMYFIINL